MSDDGLIQTLEKTLFLARNGKVAAFVGMILSDKSEINQIMEVPQEHVVTMIGLSTLMLRDIQTLCPVFDMAYDVEIIDDE